MKSYTLLFRVGPPGLFGLPQEGTVVMPGKQAGTFYGPTLDSRSGQFVGYGKLSEYRSDDEAVSFKGSIGGCSLEVRDIFFTLTAEASERRTALQIGTTVFEQFLRLLSVEYGTSFGYDLLQIESADGELEVRPGPKSFELVRASIFDTQTMVQKIAAAAASSHVDDLRLTKALLYHEHASVLFELRTHVGMFSPHFAFLLTSAYLSVWKAITTILGEPGTDSDYQSRFRKFGLPKDYWQNEVKPLQNVRNDFDVAHYSLDSTAINRVETSFGAASRVCRDVIKAYVEHLGQSTDQVAGSDKEKSNKAQRPRSHARSSRAKSKKQSRAARD